jgi:hypothetical protein
LPRRGWLPGRIIAMSDSPINTRRDAAPTPEKRHGSALGREPRGDRVARK